MLTIKNPKPMLISIKFNMIRFHKYFAFAIVTFLVNVGLGQLIPKATVTNVSCNGGSNGSIKISKTQSQLFEFTKDNGLNWINDSLFSGLVALPASNRYVIGYRDKATQPLTWDTIQVPLIEPLPLVITFPALSLKQVTCFGGDNGEIFANVSGGTSGYSYSWNTTPVLNTAQIIKLKAGNYEVTVTDNNGCIEKKSTTITEPSKISATSVITNIDCNGTSTGAVEITASGGTVGLGYAYEWTSTASGFPKTTEDISGVPAGTYNLKIKDGNTCEENFSYTITELSAIANSETITNVNCFGDNTGKIELSTSGGTGPYSYSWTSTVSGFTSTNSKDISTLKTGNYSVEVTDAKSCKKTFTYTVTEPAAALSATATPTNLNCNKDNTGAISLSVSGGTSSYTYTWTSVGAFTSAAEDISGIAADEYSVKVTDAKGCEFSINSIKVTEPDKLTLTSIITDVLCNGESTGKVDLSVAGGTAGFTYSWTDAGSYTNNTEDLLALPAAEYTVVVTDANGCKETLKNKVIEPTKIVITVDLVTDVVCYGKNTGAIDITTTGGVGTYDFQWNDPLNSTTESISSLIAGDYNLTVVDDNSCVATTKVTITEPTEISITETHVDNVCNGEQLGSIDATVSGGTPAATGNPYTFDWQSGGSQVDVTEDLTNLAAGLYDLTVTDDESCVMTLSVEIKEPTKIKAAGNVTDVACYQGNTGDIVMSITDGTVAGSSNYKVSWTGPGGYISNDQDITTLYAGDYDYTIEDDNACQITGTITVTEPTELILSYTSASVCDGDGELTFSAIGGTSATGDYQFDVDGVPSTSPINNLFDGLYIVKVTDDNGCEDTVQARVKHVDLVLPAVKTKMKVVYLDASGTATIATTDIDNVSTDNCGIKSFSLDKTSFNCTEVGQNIVTLTVTDINDNVNSDTASVFVRDTISPTISVIDIVIAIDTSGKAYLTESMVTTASGDNCKVKDTTLSAYQFDLTKLGNNSVDVTITDVNGNSKTKKINVNVYIADSDKDSIPDYIERNFDTDGDGTPNYLDLDSDDDAISDLVENDSQKSYAGQDFDGDGIPNALDLDSDDDGINDIIEMALSDNDTDGNGKKDNLIIVGVPNDQDTDGSPDYLDFDSDNDGIFDIIESLSKHTDANSDGKVDGVDTDKDGIKDEADGSNVWSDNGDKRPINSDGADALEDWRDLDSDEDGIDDKTEGLNNTDGDLLPNYLDLDSDEDGIDDKTETAIDTDGDGKGNYIDTDSDEDGIDDKTETAVDTDGDGKGNYIDTDSDEDAIDDKTETAADADGDGKGNYIDTDSDEDGIDDKTETTSDPDGDTKGNWLDDDSDGDGIVDKTETAADLDGDGIGNWLDLDSDDDELTDQVEGILDVNNNGKLDFVDAQYVIPEGFSPNGDGVNDNFYITGLRVYKESELIVINQWGQAVYESGLGYTNNWDGNYGGNGLKFGTGTVPEGIYYFVFKPNKFDLPNITGNIYIKP